MPEDVSGWFQLAATMIGIVGIATGAWMYTRSRLSFELLRGDLTDARAREADLRQQLADARAHNAKSEGENAQLAERVEVLTQLVTRAPDLAGLQGEVNTLVRIVRADYANMAPLLHLLVQDKLQGRSYAEPAQTTASDEPPGRER